jgi:hypothetical protein
MFQPWTGFSLQLNGNKPSGNPDHNIDPCVLLCILQVFAKWQQLKMKTCDTPHCEKATDLMKKTGKVKKIIMKVKKLSRSGFFDEKAYHSTSDFLVHHKYVCHCLPLLIHM